MLQLMGSQRVRHDLAMEQQHTPLCMCVCTCVCLGAGHKCRLTDTSKLRITNASGTVSVHALTLQSQDIILGLSGFLTPS